MIIEIRNKIHDLVVKYEANRDFYRTLKFNETEVRNQFLDPLFEILGWDIRNTSGRNTNECEVLLEESLKENASIHSKKPDYTFRLLGERKFFLEAKKPCVRIDKEDAPAKQVRRYGYTAGLKISILKIVKKPENVDRDIVTTPNFVIREILRLTAVELINGKNDEQINDLKCADIACGSGAFLLELYQLLYDSLVDYYLANDRSKLIQTNVDSFKLPSETKRNLLVHCIFGVDKDFNAVEACKFGLLLKLLEDEDVNTLSQFHPILPNLNENIFFGNSLFSLKDVPDANAEEINPFNFGDRHFDLIVGNPPYMKTKDIKRFTPKEKLLYEKNNRYRDLYLIKMVRIGTRKEGQSDNDIHDLRLVFEIEYVTQMFDHYKPIELKIWRTFTDTTMSFIRGKQSLSE